MNILDKLHPSSGVASSVWLGVLFGNLIKSVHVTFQKLARRCVLPEFWNTFQNIIQPALVYLIIFVPQLAKADSALAPESWKQLENRCPDIRLCARVKVKKEDFGDRIPRIQYERREIVLGASGSLVQEQQNANASRYKSTKRGKDDFWDDIAHSFGFELTFFSLGVLFSFVAFKVWWNRFYWPPLEDLFKTSNDPSSGTAAERDVEMKV